MAEYIKRDAIKARLEDLVGWCQDLRKPGLEQALAMLNEEPVADVAPVICGRWEHLGGDEWCCSSCGFVITTEGSWDKPTKKHCEECGAKMEGGTDYACL